MDLGAKPPATTKEKEKEWERNLLQPHSSKDPNS